MIDTVFIVSQPRAGSTLLQRILGAHPSIHIEAEPWILLPLLYPLRYTDSTAGYDQSIARDAICDFIETLPEGKATYLQAVRAMADTMYGSAANAAGRSIFVDKTPRYHYILPEIQATFPESRVILLYRNPLAVLASIIETFTGPDAELAAKFKNDLLDAPARLVDPEVVSQPGTTVVRYEDLVTDSENIVRGLCVHLGIEFDESMLNYGQRPAPVGRAGDPVGVHRRSRPDASALDKWQMCLSDPKVWRWFDEYIRLLCPDVVNRMGYNHSELSAVVASHRPKRQVSSRTPFSCAASLTPTTLSPMRRLRRSLATRGLRGTLLALLRR